MLHKRFVSSIFGAGMHAGMNARDVCVDLEVRKHVWILIVQTMYICHVRMPCVYAVLYLREKICELLQALWAMLNDESIHERQCSVIVM